MTIFQPGPYPTDDSNGYAAYLDDLYENFCTQIINADLEWRPRRHGLSLRRHPEISGRHNAFWHLVSGGSGEDSERNVEVERCRRVHWLRDMLDEFNARYPEETSVPIRWWKSDQARSPHDRYIIATSDFSYVAIVEDRPRYALLITAYYVEIEGRRRKFEEQCAQYWGNT